MPVRMEISKCRPCVKSTEGAGGTSGGAVPVSRNKRYICLDLWQHEVQYAFHLIEFLSKENYMVRISLFYISLVGLLAMPVMARPGGGRPGPGPGRPGPGPGRPGPGLPGHPGRRVIFLPPIVVVNPAGYNFTCQSSDYTNSTTWQGNGYGWDGQNMASQNAMNACWSSSPNGDSCYLKSCW